MEKENTQPKNQTVAHSPLVDEDELRAALDRVVFNMLRPISLLMALLLLVWFLDHVQRPPQHAIPLVMTSVATAGLFLVFGLAFDRLRLPERYSNLLMIGMAILLLFHRLLSIALTGEIAQTMSLILLVVGAGYVLLSTRWLVMFVVTLLVSWLAVVLLCYALPEWRLFALELMSAIALSVVIHLSRVRSFRYQEILRIQNHARNAELEYRALQLKTLITISYSINAILDVEALLNYVVDLVQEQFGYYYVGIFRLDKAGEYMVLKAGTGEAGQQLADKGFRLRVGEEGLVGWVAQHRQPVYVNDVTQAPRYIGTPVVPKTCSELVLPLETGEILFGILDIQSDQRDAFDDDDLYVFQSLAAQVATALQNATSYQAERSRRLLTENLYEVGRALSRTLDPRQVLDLILTSLSPIVQFDRGSVMLQVDDGAHQGALEIVVAIGFPSESRPSQIRVPIRHDDVFGQIHRSRKPLIVPEVLEREDWQQVTGLPQARSWLGVPLIDFKGEVMGMFSLTRETPVSFSEEDADLAMTFAGHAAVALQNARVYSQLAHAYEQLERLDRTKSDFITVASHELRTPLTTLRGFSQILLKDPQIHTDPVRSEMMEGIFNGAVRLHEIIDSMVDMARIDSRTLQLYVEMVHLSQIVEKVLKPLQPALQDRRLLLRCEGLEELPPLKADPDLLQKVFHHLVTNAVKYTPDGGRIVLSGRVLPLGQWNLSEGGVEIVVRDTGIGIDPDFHDLIFAKFYQTGEVALHSSGRTKFKGGGAGLGLSIAKGIVEAHGGRIWVESPGYDEETCPGSTFHVVLPMQPPEILEA
ncbi:MAG: GAF domain-containing protein [Anaerolineae bacterium]|nr:GAF domain-containing protein [Anaerolineae bacterium]